MLHDGIGSKCSEKQKILRYQATKHANRQTDLLNAILEHIKNNPMSYMWPKVSIFSKIEQKKNILFHKLLPGLYQGFIRCNGKC